jgi:hypothetical protein
MFDQEGFARIVKGYNDDYRLLLKRASEGHYDCLITTGLVLRDLYNVIHVLYDTGGYSFDVLPYPFTFRQDDVLLRQLGFDDLGIRNIHGFLDYVKATQGMAFEDCLDAGSAVMCERLR